VSRSAQHAEGGHLFRNLQQTPRVVVWQTIPVVVRRQHLYWMVCYSSRSCLTNSSCGCQTKLFQCCLARYSVLNSSVLFPWLSDKALPAVVRQHSSHIRLTRTFCIQRCGSLSVVVRQHSSHILLTRIFCIRLCGSFPVVVRRTLPVSLTQNSVFDSPVLFRSCLAKLFLWL
jgi:hypothetical protein